MAEANDRLRGAPTDAEQLLAWSAALRRLARRLAPDEGAAEDLLQDAWLAALTAREAPRSGWIAWMKGVLRHKSRERRRAAARIAARERAVARGEALADSSETIERLDLQAVLLRGLRALPEPYRRALVERWLEERPIAEIAARTATPLRTVERRLADGLALLRTRLERAGRSDPMRWLGAVVGLVETPKLTWILMSAKQRVVVLSFVAAVLGTLGVSVLLATRDERAPLDRSHAALAPQHDRIADTRTDGLQHDAGSDATLDAARSAIAPGEPAATATIARTRLTGRLVDARGTPVSGALVWARSAAPTSFGLESRPHLLAPLFGAEAEETWRAARTARSDAEGRFEFADLGPGAVDLAVRAAGFAPLDLAFVGLPRDGRDLGTIELGDGARLSGFVVDVEGRAVEGARLAWQRPGRDGGAKVRIPAGTSAADGSFAIDGVPRGPFVVVATIEETIEGVVDGECTTSSCAGLRIVVGEGDTVRGRVVGAPVPVRVAAMLDDDAYGTGPRRWAELASDGSFEVRGLPTGKRWQLQLYDAQDADWRPELRAKVVVAGGTTDAVLEYPAALPLGFRAIDEVTRAPVSVESIQIMGFDVWSTAEDLQRDADGVHRAFVRWTGGESAVAGLRAPTHVPVHVRLPSGPVGAALDLGTIAMKSATSLEVRVVAAEDGAPIEGASVEFGLAGHEEPERLGPEPGAILHLLPTTGSGTTDAGGVVRLPADTSLHLGCWVAAAGFGAWQGNVEAGRDTLEVRLPRTIALHVRVLVAGEPALSRPVRAHGTGSHRSNALVSTDERGIATFEAVLGGRYRIGVPLSSAPAAYHVATDVEVERDGQEVVLELPRPAVLEGRVLRSGVPVAGARVAGRAGWSSATRAAGVAGSATTAADGRFTLDDLVPGRLALIVEHGASPLAMEWSLDVGPGVNRHEIDFAPATVSGRLVDDTGAPVGNVALEFTAALIPMAQRHVVARATTDADGAFRFDDVPHGTPVRLVVPLQSHAAPRSDLRFEPFERRHLGVVVAPRGATVVVSIAANGGVESAVVSLRSEAGMRGGTVTSAAPLTIRGIPPGVWTIDYRIDGTLRPDLTERHVELAPGATIERVLGGP